MKRLNKLANAMNTVRDLANKIIATAVPIMKELQTVENDLVDEFLEEHDIDSNLALSLLQDRSLTLIRDSETVLKEIESFSESVIQGEDAVDEGADDYPFLIQVWYGDTYGESDLKGINSLILDLQEQLSQIDEDKILEAAMARYVSTEHVIKMSGGKRW